MLDDKKLHNIALALNGVNYSEWSRIKNAIEKLYSSASGKIVLNDCEAIQRMLKLENFNL